MDKSHSNHIEKFKHFLKKYRFYIGVIIVAACWNYSELKFQHLPEACSFLQDMGILEIVKTLKNEGWDGARLFLHSLYHNIRDSSLTNALSFCSLFALVIAMIQTIYPHRLGSNRGYPILKLDEEPVGREEVKGLILSAGLIILMEFLKLYIIEVSIALIGCGVIARWLLKLLDWYKHQENSSILFFDKAKGYLKTILDSYKTDKPNNDERVQAEEELKRILIGNTQTAGIEEQEFLEEFAALLLDPYKYLKGSPDTEEITKKGRRTIFEFSFYLSNNIAKKCMDTTLVGYSRYYRMLKKSLGDAQYHIGYGEAFIKGILLGSMATCDEQMIRGCVDEMIPSIENRIEREQFSELIGCLCVFLELYANVNDDILYGVDYLLKSGCFEMIDEFASEDAKKMQECYNDLVGLEILDSIDEYDVVRALTEEINMNGEILNKMPQTILGGLNI